MGIVLFINRFTQLPALLLVLAVVAGTVALVYVRFRSGTLLARYPFIRRAFWVIMIYFCFSAANFELNAGRRYQQVKQWPLTDAIINSASVSETRYSWGSQRFCPQLGYTYSIKGHSFASSNKVFDFTCWPDAYGFVDRHRPGTSIQIAYDPTNPTVTVVPTSIQDPGGPWGDMIGGIFFLLILIADFLSVQPLSAN
jgi:hypothetical protein